MPKDMRGVMHEFKHGELHSGSKHGPVVGNRKQAIAIGLSEQRQQGKTVPPKKSTAHSRREPDAQRFADKTPVGFGSLPRQPRPIKNTPKTLAGRRAASHRKAYADNAD